ncbi:hypothetical protein AB0D49_25085 [Streptomyces sp. NPDC048290]|uniref:hypothetical protein n=1 Tax=Streptomyces sp. NPDC048290 TaxID=3155811 RepID=UPI00343C7477
MPCPEPREAPRLKERNEAIDDFNTTEVKAAHEIQEQIAESALRGTKLTDLGASVQGLYFGSVDSDQGKRMQELNVFARLPQSEIPGLKDDGTETRGKVYYLLADTDPDTGLPMDSRGQFIPAAHIVYALLNKSDWDRNSSLVFLNSNLASVSSSLVRDVQAGLLQAGVRSHAVASLTDVWFVGRTGSTDSGHIVAQSVINFDHSGNPVLSKLLRWQSTHTANDLQVSHHLTLPELARQDNREPLETKSSHVDDVHPNPPEGTDAYDVMRFGNSTPATKLTDLGSDRPGLYFGDLNGKHARDLQSRNAFQRLPANTDNTFLLISDTDKQGRPIDSQGNQITAERMVNALLDDSGWDGVMRLTLLNCGIGTLNRPFVFRLMELLSERQQRTDLQYPLGMLWLAAKKGTLDPGEFLAGTPKFSISQSGTPVLHDVNEWEIARRRKEDGSYEISKTLATLPPGNGDVQDSQGPPKAPGEGSDAPSHLPPVSDWTTVEDTYDIVHFGPESETGDSDEESVTRSENGDGNERGDERDDENGDDDAVPADTTPAGVLSSLQDRFGLTLDSQAGVRAVQETNPRLSPEDRSQVRDRTLTDPEIQGLNAALEHFAPLLGARRQTSNRSGTEQEVTTLGAVTTGNGFLGTPETSQYIASHRTLNLYADPSGGDGTGPDAQETEGATVRALAHGLLSYALPEFTSAFGTWDADGRPVLGEGVEPPHGATTPEADFVASIRSYLMRTEQFLTERPRHAAAIRELASRHPGAFVRGRSESVLRAAPRIAQQLASELDAFTAQVGTFDADGALNTAGEKPFGAKSNASAADDLAETAKQYFLAPDALRAKAPRRAEFFDRLVADWQPSDRSGNGSDPDGGDRPDSDRDSDGPERGVSTDPPGRNTPPRPHPSRDTGRDQPDQPDQQDQQSQTGQRNTDGPTRRNTDGPTRTTGTTTVTPADQNAPSGTQSEEQPFSLVTLLENAGEDEQFLDDLRTANAAEVDAVEEALRTGAGQLYPYLWSQAPDHLRDAIINRLTLVGLHMTGDAVTRLAEHYAREYELLTLDAEDGAPLVLRARTLLDVFHPSYRKITPKDMVLPSTQGLMRRLLTDQQHMEHHQRVIEIAYLLHKAAEDGDEELSSAVERAKEMENGRSSAGPDVVRFTEIDHPSPKVTVLSLFGDTDLHGSQRLAHTDTRSVVTYSVVNDGKSTQWHIEDATDADWRDQHVLFIDTHGGPQRFMAALTKPSLVPGGDKPGHAVVSPQHLAELLQQVPEATAAAQKAFTAKEPLYVVLIACRTLEDTDLPSPMTALQLRQYLNLGPQHTEEQSPDVRLYATARPTQVSGKGDVGVRADKGTPGDQRYQHVENPSNQRATISVAPGSFSGGLSLRNPGDAIFRKQVQPSTSLATVLGGKKAAFLDMGWYGKGVQVPHPTSQNPSANVTLTMAEVKNDPAVRDLLEDGGDTVVLATHHAGTPTIKNVDGELVADFSDTPAMAFAKAGGKHVKVVAPVGWVQPKSTDGGVEVSVNQLSDHQDWLPTWVLLDPDQPSPLLKKPAPVTSETHGQGTESDEPAPTPPPLGFRSAADIDEGEKNPAYEHERGEAPVYPVGVGAKATAIVMSFMTFPGRQGSTSMPLPAVAASRRLTEQQVHTGLLGFSQTYQQAYERARDAYRSTADTDQETTRNTVVTVAADVGLDSSYADEWLRRFAQEPDVSDNLDEPVEPDLPTNGDETDAVNDTSENVEPTDTDVRTDEPTDLPQPSPEQPPTDQRPTTEPLTDQNSTPQTPTTSPAAPAPRRTDPDRTSVSQAPEEPTPVRRPQHTGGLAAARRELAALARQQFGLPDDTTDLDALATLAREVFRGEGPDDQADQVTRLVWLGEALRNLPWKRSLDNLLVARQLFDVVRQQEGRRRANADGLRNVVRDVLDKRKGDPVSQQDHANVFTFTALLARINAPANLAGLRAVHSMWHLMDHEFPSLTSVLRRVRTAAPDLAELSDTDLPLLIEAAKDVDAYQARIGDLVAALRARTTGSRRGSTNGGPPPRSRRTTSVSSASGVPTATWTNSGSSVFTGNPPTRANSGSSLFTGTVPTRANSISSVFTGTPSTRASSGTMLLGSDDGDSGDTGSRGGVDSRFSDLFEVMSSLTELDEDVSSSHDPYETPQDGLSESEDMDGSRTEPLERGETNQQHPPLTRAGVKQAVAMTHAIEGHYVLNEATGYWELKGYHFYNPDWSDQIQVQEDPRYPDTMENPSWNGVFHATLAPGPNAPYRFVMNKPEHTFFGTFMTWPVVYNTLLELADDGKLPHDGPFRVTDRWGNGIAGATRNGRLWYFYPYVTPEGVTTRDNPWIAAKLDEEARLKAVADALAAQQLAMTDDNFPVLPTPSAPVNLANSGRQSAAPVRPDTPEPTPLPVTSVPADVPSTPPVSPTTPQDLPQSEPTEDTPDSQTTTEPPAQPVPVTLASLYDLVDDYWRNGPIRDKQTTHDLTTRVRDGFTKLTLGGTAAGGGKKSELDFQRGVLFDDDSALIELMDQAPQYVGKVPADELWSRARTLLVAGWTVLKDSGTDVDAFRNRVEHLRLSVGKSSDDVTRALDVLEAEVRIVRALRGPQPPESTAAQFQTDIDTITRNLPALVKRKVLTGGEAQDHSLSLTQMANALAQTTVDEPTDAPWLSQDQADQAAVKLASVPKRIEWDTYIAAVRSKQMNFGNQIVVLKAVRTLIDQLTFERDLMFPLLQSLRQDPEQTVEFNKLLKERGIVVETFEAQADKLMEQGIAFHGGVNVDVQGGIIKGVAEAKSLISVARSNHALLSPTTMAGNAKMRATLFNKYMSDATLVAREGFRYEWMRRNIEQGRNSLGDQITDTEKKLLDLVDAAARMADSTRAGALVAARSVLDALDVDAVIAAENSMLIFPEQVWQLLGNIERHIATANGPDATDEAKSVELNRLATLSAEYAQRTWEEYEVSTLVEKADRATKAEAASRAKEARLAKEARAAKGKNKRNKVKISEAENPTVDSYQQIKFTMDMELHAEIQLLFGIEAVKNNQITANELNMKFYTILNHLKEWGAFYKVDISETEQRIKNRIFVSKIPLASNVATGVKIATSHGVTWSQTPYGIYSQWQALHLDKWLRGLAKMDDGTSQDLSESLTVLRNTVARDAWNGKNLSATSMHASDYVGSPRWAPVYEVVDGWPTPRVSPKNRVAAAREHISKIQYWTAKLAVEQNGVLNATTAIQGAQALLRALPVLLANGDLGPEANLLIKKLELAAERDQGYQGQLTAMLELIRSEHEVISFVLSGESEVTTEALLFEEYDTVLLTAVSRGVGLPHQSSYLMNDYDESAQIDHLEDRAFNALVLNLRYIELKLSNLSDAQHKLLEDQWAAFTDVRRGPGHPLRGLNLDLLSYSKVQRLKYALHLGLDSESGTGHDSGPATDLARYFFKLDIPITLNQVTFDPAPTHLVTTDPDPGHFDAANVLERGVTDPETSRRTEAGQNSGVGDVRARTQQPRSLDADLRALGDQVETVMTLTDTPEGPDESPRLTEDGVEAGEAVFHMIRGHYRFDPATATYELKGYHIVDPGRADEIVVNPDPQYEYSQENPTWNGVFPARLAPGPKARHPFVWTKPLHTFFGPGMTWKVVSASLRQMAREGKIPADGTFRATDRWGNGIGGVTKNGKLLYFYPLMTKPGVQTRQNPWIKAQQDHAAEMRVAREAEAALRLLVNEQNFPSLSSTTPTTGRPVQTSVPIRGQSRPPADTQQPVQPAQNTQNTDTTATSKNTDSTEDVQESRTVPRRPAPAQRLISQPTTLTDLYDLTDQFWKEHQDRDQKATRKVLKDIKKGFAVLWLNPASDTGTDPEAEYHRGRLFDDDKALFQSMTAARKYDGLIPQPYRQTRAMALLTSGWEVLQHTTDFAAAEQRINQLTDSLDGAPDKIIKAVEVLKAQLRIAQAKQGAQPDSYTAQDFRHDVGTLARNLPELVGKGLLSKADAEAMAATVGEIATGLASPRDPADPTVPFLTPRQADLAIVRLMAVNTRIEWNQFLAKGGSDVPTDWKSAAAMLDAVLNQSMFERDMTLGLLRAYLADLDMPDASTDGQPAPHILDRFDSLPEVALLREELSTAIASYEAKMDQFRKYMGAVVQKANSVTEEFTELRKRYQRAFNTVTTLKAALNALDKEQHGNPKTRQRRLRQLVVDSFAVHPEAMRYKKVQVEIEENKKLFAGDFSENETQLLALLDALSQMADATPPEKLAKANTVLDLISADLLMTAVEEGSIMHGHDWRMLATIERFITSAFGPGTTKAGKDAAKARLAQVQADLAEAMWQKHLADEQRKAETEKGGSRQHQPPLTRQQRENLAISARNNLEIQAEAQLLLGPDLVKQNRITEDELKARFERILKDLGKETALSPQLMRNARSRIGRRAELSRLALGVNDAATDLKLLDESGFDWAGTHLNGLDFWQPFHFDRWVREAAERHAGNQRLAARFNELRTRASTRLWSSGYEQSTSSMAASYNPAAPQRWNSFHQKLQGWPTDRLLGAKRVTQHQTMVREVHDWIGKLAVHENGAIDATHMIAAAHSLLKALPTLMYSGSSESQIELLVSKLEQAKHQPSGHQDRLIAVLNLIQQERRLIRLVMNGTPPDSPEAVEIFEEHRTALLNLRRNRTDLDTRDTYLDMGITDPADRDTLPDHAKLAAQLPYRYMELSRQLVDDTEHIGLTMQWRKFSNTANLPTDHQLHGVDFTTFTPEEQMRVQYALFLARYPKNPDGTHDIDDAVDLAHYYAFGPLSPLTS